MHALRGESDPAFRPRSFHCFQCQSSFTSRDSPEAVVCPLCRESFVTEEDPR
jgi:hypothetical protein